MPSITYPVFVEQIDPYSLITDYTIYYSLVLIQVAYSLSFIKALIFWVIHFIYNFRIISIHVKKARKFWFSLSNVVVFSCLHFQRTSVVFLYIIFKSSCKGFPVSVIWTHCTIFEFFETKTPDLHRAKSEKKKDRNLGTSLYFKITFRLLAYFYF